MCWYNIWSALTSPEAFRRFWPGRPFVLVHQVRRAASDGRTWRRGIPLGKMKVFPVMFFVIFVLPFCCLRRSFANGASCRLTPGSPCPLAAVTHLPQVQSRRPLTLLEVRYFRQECTRYLVLGKPLPLLRNIFLKIIMKKCSLNPIIHRFQLKDKMKGRDIQGLVIQG